MLDMTEITAMLLTNTCAALRRVGFVKSGCTSLALGLGGGGTADIHVLARGALGVGGAEVVVVRTS